MERFKWWKKSKEEVIAEVGMLVGKGINHLSLMTKADYSGIESLPFSREHWKGVA